MKLLGWLILIGMLLGTVASVIEKPSIILFIVVIFVIFGGLRWNDR